MLGMFLGALDQTIVSTSIRTIADDLQGLSVQAWVTTAYLITATITTPIYGKLGDLYGRKKLFMFAISVFIVGLGAVRVRDVDVPAGGVPGAPGPRRRRAVHAGAGDHRRHRVAAGARAVHRLLHGDVRHLERARPGDRRVLRRPGRAVRRPPAGAGCSWSTCRSASLALFVVARTLHVHHARSPERHPHRLVGRDRARRRPRAAAHWWPSRAASGAGPRPRR